MNPLRALAMATAIELCLAVTVATAAGLYGAVDPRLDLVNDAAPVLLAVSVLGAVAARLALPPGRLRLACAGLTLLAALYNLALIAPDGIGRVRGRAAPAAGRPYKVAVANLYHDNYEPTYAAIAILTRRADAVMLEETSGSPAAVSLLDQAYPYSTTCFSDVKIWVKRPILAQGCGLDLPAEAFQTWGRAFAWLRTTGPDGRPVTLAVAHLGRPSQPLRQALERRALAEALRRLPRDETILGGDFNTAPWSFAMFAQDRVLAPLRRLTFLQPTFPAAFLHRRWDYPLLPIDHLYAGGRWTAASIVRFRTNGSDHAGLEANLRLRP